MPGVDLRGFAGLWGKLPATGDFVGRGLPREFQGRWDAWVTRHLAPRRACWPAGGLRLRLASGVRTASGIVLPSADAVGRRYPLSALAVLPFAPSLAQVDAWCDAAQPPLGEALAGALGADDLWKALEAIPLPEAAAEERASIPPSGAGQGEALLLLWTRGAEALAADPRDPGPVLNALSSRGSLPP